MEAASIAHPAGGHATEHSHGGAGEHHGPTAGQPQLAGGPPAARDAAFHHLRDHDLRGVLHGLLLHPRRPGRPLAGPRHQPAGRCPPLFNTSILVSSSFTMHWAQTAIKNNNRFALKAAYLDLSARRDLPLHPDQRVRQHRLRPPGPRAADDLLLAHRPARRARGDRSDAAPDRHDPLLPRALHRRGAPRRRGARDLLALR